MYRIGIDLGGTNIALGIIKEDSIVFKSSIPTDLPKQPKELVKNIAGLVDASLEKFGIDIKDVQRIGIGIPGSVNNATGFLEFANNFGYTHVPLITMLREAFTVPVFAENDANVAALAEYTLGAARGAVSMAMFTLGTGVGGAYISNGEILTGVNGAAAELGHEVIVVDGLLCSCGRRGCSEMYASATALTGRARMLAKSDVNSILYKKMKDSSRFGVKEVLDAMKEGDDLARSAFEEYLKYLSAAMANIINIFQPEVFVLGGGVSHAGEVLLGPLREMVHSQVYSRSMDINTRLELAVLGNDAGILGAGRLGE